MDISRLLLDDSASFVDAAKSYRTPLPDPFGQALPVLGLREQLAPRAKADDHSLEMQLVDENAILPGARYRKDPSAFEEDQCKTDDTPAARPEQGVEKR